MPDKLIDNEITKVLECCVELFYENNVRCDQTIEDLADDVKSIFDNLINFQKSQIIKEQNKNSKLRNKINRLKAENERLKPFEEKIAEFKSHIRVEDMLVFASSLEEWLEFCDNLKTEAYKDFARELMLIPSNTVRKDEIRNLLKEFEEKINDN